MACNRVSQIDLAAFVDDPLDARWSTFRDHFEHCSECGGEVNTWRDVIRRLRGVDRDEDAHPSPRDLAAYSTDAEMQRRTEIDAHLQRCPSCATELETLRTFDFDRLRQPLASHRGSTFFESLRSLFARPALAYALLAISLVSVAVFRRADVAPAERVRSLPPEVATTVVLSSDGIAQAPHPGPNGSLALQVPLPTGTDIAEVEVSVISPDESKQLQARLPAADPLEIEVPGLWLARGPHRVVVKTGAQPVEELRLFVR